MVVIGIGHLLLSLVSRPPLHAASERGKRGKEGEWTSESSGRLSLPPFTSAAAQLRSDRRSHTTAISPASSNHFSPPSLTCHTSASLGGTRRLHSNDSSAHHITRYRLADCERRVLHSSSLGDSAAATMGGAALHSIEC